METMFLICAIIGGTLIVCQFILSLFGLGADDAGGAEGGAELSDAEVGHGSQSSLFFGMLTFKTLSAALAFFGFTGLAAPHFELEPAPTLLLSLAAGVGALFLVGFLLRGLGKLNVDGTVRIDRSIGSRGTVYLPIPAQRGGVGKVLVSVLNRTMEYKAITPHDALLAGAKIVVIGVVSPDTVEVKSSTEA